MTDLDMDSIEINSQPRILVTGATGYAASHVTQQLLKQGFKVRGTTRDLKNDFKVKPLQELQPRENLELVEADLLDEASWIPAVEGCQYVLHLASPITYQPVKDEDIMIKPIVGGTLSILKACVAAKTVKRVVITSSIAAVSQGFAFGGMFDECDWTDPSKPDLDPYSKAKTLMEKAAWEFVDNLKEVKFELAVINPVYILGPVLVNRHSASMVLPKMLMEGEVPFLPCINYAVVDVRDVAAAHIQAMLVPEAAGHRHIVNNGNLTFREIAEILSLEFQDQGYQVATTTVPDFLIKLYGLFNDSVNPIVPTLSKITFYNNSRMTTILKVHPHPEGDTILDMAHSMIERGQIRKSEKYTGPTRRSACKDDNSNTKE